MGPLRTLVSPSNWGLIKKLPLGRHLSQRVRLNVLLFDMQEAWNEFQAWVNNQQNAVTETVQYLEGFCAVIDFECNRPYLHWYDTSARDVIIAQETENKLREILTPGFTAEETTEYLNSLKKPSLLEKLTSDEA